MYCIAMDSSTKSFYMDPWEVKFRVYTSSGAAKSLAPGKAKIVETDLTDRKELTTLLFNAGFSEGYVDEKPVRLTKEDSYYYAVNYNEVCFAQYLITGDEKYLQSIRKKNLLSLCKIEEDGAYFPTVELEDGSAAVLAYTDRFRIPQVLFDKYPDYRPVKMSFATKVLVNSKFSVE